MRARPAPPATYVKLSQVIRYSSFLGLPRVVFKILGRLRTYLRPLSFLTRTFSPKDVAIVGCGQFAFSTIGFFHTFSVGNRFLRAFDINQNQQDTFETFYNIRTRTNSFNDILEDARIKHVFVASNHASHSEYAVRSLHAHKNVYVEKPIGVDYRQLASLYHAISGHPDLRCHFGYNRPFSRSIQEIRRCISSDTGPLTFSAFITGHFLPLNHWYRSPSEGTRICGNLGHWIDLFIHLMYHRGLPELLTIRLTPANPHVPDDNLCLAISTDKADLCSITFSSHSEPFEGIRETINVSFGSDIYTIDDFRAMTHFSGYRKRTYNYFPKDVGHKACVTQPFSSSPTRDPLEVFDSSLLVLHVASMAKSGEFHSVYSIPDQRSRLATI